MEMSKNVKLHSINVHKKLKGIVHPKIIILSSFTHYVMITFLNIDNNKKCF